MSEKLPKKWCVRSEHKSLRDYCNKHGAHPPYTTQECAKFYCHFPKVTTDYCTITTSARIGPGYTEITFEQFEKYVLNNKEGEKKMEEKTIIGYELIKSEYEEAAIAITGFISGPDKFKVWMRKSPDGKFAERLRDAGVLDLWFEPIYEEDEYPVGEFILLEDSHAECMLGCNGIGNGVFEIVSKDTPSSNGLPNNDNWTVKAKGNDGRVWKLAPKSRKFKLATPSDIEYWRMPNIEIRDHKAVFDPKGQKVTFGCQEWSYAEVKEFVRYLDRSGLKIADFDKQVRDVKKYFDGH